MSNIPKFSFDENQGTVSKPKNKKKNNETNPLVHFFITMPLFALVLMVGLTALALFLGFTYFNLKKQSGDVLGQVNIDPKEYNTVLEKLKKVVEISDGEPVNIALINDVEKLSKEDPQFYKDAVKGQYLVVLPHQQKIIIFDKKDNKIVNFSSYRVDIPLIPEKEIPKAEQPLNIEIRYEKDTPQLKLEQIKKLVTDSSKLFKITEVKESKKDDYKTVSVIVLNRNKKNLVNNILSYMQTNNVLTKLPEGEEETKADVIIVVNKD